MSIIVGNDEISKTQLNYLQSAKSGLLPPMLAEVFAAVFNDSDINSGKEKLLPEWIDLFRKEEINLRKELPDFIIDKLAKIVDSITIIDSKISEIDPQAMKMAFLLGAGASKPEPSGIPTVKELLPDLLVRARRLDREDMTKLADFCDESGITNIEDLLTGAQLSNFCSRNPYILNIVNYLLFRRDNIDAKSAIRQRKSNVEFSSIAFLQDNLQLLFGLLSNRMLPAKPNKGHEAIADYAKNKPNTSIITTNYDCCMDLALGEQNKDFSYLVDFHNSRPDINNNGTKLTALIKLHGSLNWFYCDTCQEIYLIDFKQTVADYMADRSSYPVVGVCRGCGGQRRSLLVPPLAMKFDVAPPLNQLHERAQGAFNSADVVVVVGFSFADADAYISRMLSKWMRASDTSKLIIFDPDTNVVHKIRRQFMLRMPQFESTRILAVPGDCSIKLPSFLSGALQKELMLSANSKKERKIKPRRVSS